MSVEMTKSHAKLLKALPLLKKEWNETPPATVKYYTSHCTNRALSKRDSCLQNPRMQKASERPSYPFSKVCLGFSKTENGTIFFQIKPNVEMQLGNAKRKVSFT